MNRRNVVLQGNLVMVPFVAVWTRKNWVMLPYAVSLQLFCTCKDQRASFTSVSTRYFQCQLTPFYVLGYRFYNAEIGKVFLQKLKLNMISYVGFGTGSGNFACL